MSVFCLSALADFLVEVYTCENIYIYAFDIWHFYSKQLAQNCIPDLCFQFMHSLGIEPMTLLVFAVLFELQKSNKNDSKSAGAIRENTHVQDSSMKTIHIF